MLTLTEVRKANPDARPLPADVVLANGRVVTHSFMSNGAHFAEMADCGDMSNADWEEYCAIVKSFR